MFNQGSSCPMEAPSSICCNNVVQTCNVQDVPFYTNYHTHQVNNCIKRHINIPVYSSSYENVLINQYVEGTPIYQAPTYQTMYGNPLYQQPMYNNQMMYQQPTAQYQGNVGTEAPQFNPFGR